MVLMFIFDSILLTPNIIIVLWCYFPTWTCLYCIFIFDFKRPRQNGLEKNNTLFIHTFIHINAIQLNTFFLVDFCSLASNKVLFAFLDWRLSSSPCASIRLAICQKPHTETSCGSEMNVTCTERGRNCAVFPLFIMLWFFKKDYQNAIKGYSDPKTLAHVPVFYCWIYTIKIPNYVLLFFFEWKQVF